jgi:diguanylate cyclase (GGDEF)-like protein/PAS domain S-box-containing protein
VQGLLAVLRGVPYPVQTGLFTAVYFVVAKLSLLLAIAPGYATPAWPPAGIALAALLLLGKRLWPGIWLGAAMANFGIESSYAGAAAIAGGNTLEALVCAALIQRWIPKLGLFEHPQDVVKFFAFAASSAAIAATIGMTALAVMHGLPWPVVLQNWVTWWQGDATGIVVVTPLLLSWAVPGTTVWSPKKKWEAVFFLVMLAFAAQLAFNSTTAKGEPVSIVFTVPPLIILAAFRFGQREVSAGIAVVSSIVVWFALEHNGVFTPLSPNATLLVLLAFICTTTAIGYLFCAMLHERLEAMQALQESHDHLDTMVRKRTYQLDETIQTLREDIAARQRAEKLLQQSEQRTRLIIDTANDAFVGMDAEGIITIWNAEAVRLFGWPREEAIGRLLADTIIPPRYRQAHVQGLKRFLATGTGRLINKWIQIDAQHRDGREIRVELNVWPVRSDDTYLFNAFIHDITERERAEKALHESEERFRLMISSVADYGIFMLDLEGRVMTWNAGAERMTGYRAEEVIGKHISIFYTTEDVEQDKARNELEIATTTGAFEEEGWRVRKDGTRFWTSIVLTPMRDDAGTLRGFCKVTRDLTERKRAEKALHESEERFGLMISSVADYGIFMLDLEGRVMTWNAGAERMTGYRTEEVIGKNISIFYTTDEDVKPDKTRNELEIATTEGVFEEEGWRVRKDGTRFWASIVLTAMRDDAGTLRGFCKVTRDLTERKRSEEMLAYLVQYDKLTGLPNRLVVHDGLALMLAQAQHSRTQIGCMFVDLDRFKNVNDTLGHNVGDNLLIQAAQRLLTCVRSGDIVGRVGGDEFVLVLANLNQPTDASLVAQKVTAAFAAPFDLDGHETYVSASLGIAAYPEDGTTADELLKNADLAMYRAKDLGRNNYQFYLREMHERALARLQLEGSMHGALERKEFFLEYQPKTDLCNGAISGFEALLRWQHPERGLMQPTEFVQILESTGLIVPIGEWVLHTVCQQIKAWQAQGLVVRPIAINLSARQFHKKNLDVVLAHIEKTGIDPALLEFELTESMLMTDVEEVVQTLERLKNFGVHLSVDDFGTGYSSLAYLQRFPLNALKIDRAFIRDVTINSNDADIARAIISLAHSLKLKVVAEGVETQEQLQFLYDLKCDEMQGYYFSRPMSAEICTSMLVENRCLPMPVEA